MENYLKQFIIFIAWLFQKTNIDLTEIKKEKEDKNQGTGFIFNQTTATLRKMIEHEEEQRYLIIV